MKRDSAELDAISLTELYELWPKGDEGKLCARLLCRYGFSMLVASAIGAECTEERAQAEAGASKALAKMLTDFGGLSRELPERAPKKPMQTLHRFEQKKSSTPETS